MGAPEGNTNAQKEGTRVSACLSIADARRAWVVRQLLTQGIEKPTSQQISRFVKDFCYAKIDKAMQE